MPTSSKEIDFLQFQVMQLNAEVCALIGLFEKFYPDNSNGWKEEFIENRRKLALKFLESLETRDPAQAARIHEMMSKPGLTFPIDYVDSDGDGK